MIFARILDKLLGAILVLVIFSPVLVLATLAGLLNFIDLLYQNEKGDTFFSYILSPLFAAITVTFLLLENGWEYGFVGHLMTSPTRISYFFNKQLFFGTQEGESINDFITNIISPEINDIFTSGFFGQLTLKFISLCLPMEIYVRNESEILSPHNDVTIYFTQKNLDILMQKYHDKEIANREDIKDDIKNFLSSKLEENEINEQKVRGLSLADDSRPGRLQSALDAMEATKAAKRCIEYFNNNVKMAGDLGGKFECPPMTVLNYIWLAIDSECPDKQNKLVLKEKLMLTLFQIQRGFNIVNGGGGADMPECAGGAIGLLVRVICNEKDKMPDSEYDAEDPSPANLSLALKAALDRPFSSSYEQIERRIAFENDPDGYRQKEKGKIIKSWTVTFWSLIQNRALDETKMKAIIDAGVEAWEPPEEQDPSHNLSNKR